MGRGFAFLGNVLLPGAAGRLGRGPLKLCVLLSLGSGSIWCKYRIDASAISEGNAGKVMYDEELVLLCGPSPPHLVPYD